MKEDVSAVHMSSEEDLIHIRKGPVILYNLDNAANLGQCILPQCPQEHTVVYFSRRCHQGLSWPGLQTVS